MAGKKYSDAFVNTFVKDREFNMESCCMEDEDVLTSQEYQKVSCSAEVLVKHQTSMDLKPFEIYRGFKNILKLNNAHNVNTTWKDLAAAFLLLTCYSIRLLRSPWRKSFYKIKAFNGNYKYVLCEHLSDEVVKSLLMKLGYTYDPFQQTFIFNYESSKFTEWKEIVLTAGLDFFLVHFKCLTKFKSKSHSVTHRDKASKLTNKSITDDLINPYEISLSEKFSSLYSPGKASNYEIRESNKALNQHDKQILPLQYQLSNRTAADTSNISSTEFRSPPPRTVPVVNRRSNPSQSLNKLPHDNYVQALPIRQENRIESGYYSEWGNVPNVAISRLKNSSSHDLHQKQQKLTSYSKPYVTGDYVRVQPVRRTPAEGRSDPSTHNYFEIDGDNLYSPTSNY